MLFDKRRDNLTASARKTRRARVAQRPIVEVLEGRALLADFAGMASGIFVNPTPGTTFTGKDTSSFTYGEAASGSSASSLSFTGESFGAPANTPFSLGRLSFFNGTTKLGTNATSVDLSVTVNLSSPSGVTAQAFTFPLQLETTTNSKDNPQDDASRDSVFLPTSYSPQVFTTADGSRFTLQLSGFENASPGGATATERFLVREGEGASAELKARLVAAPAALPDIQVVSARADSPTTVTFGYGVQGNPGPFMVGLYRSADTTFDASDELLTSQSITPIPNASAQGEFTLQAPPTNDVNRANLLVVADPSKAIQETDESNNEALVSQQAVQADVQIIDAALDKATSTVRFEYASVGVSGSFKVGLYNSNDTSHPLDTVTVTPPPSSSSNGVLTLSFPGPFNPRHTKLLVIADPPDAAHPTGQFLETDETNNVARVVANLDVQIASRSQGIATLLKSVTLASPSPVFQINVNPATHIDIYGLQLEKRFGRQNKGMWQDVTTQGEANIRSLPTRQTGHFVVRAFAEINGVRFYSEPSRRGRVDLDINYPTANQLSQLAELGRMGIGPMAAIASQMVEDRKAAEAFSLVHTELVQEQGFSILFNTLTGIYSSIRPVIQDGMNGQKKPSLANDLNDTPRVVQTRFSSDDIPDTTVLKDFDQGATYLVANFHTHTTNQFRNVPKVVGPSEGDLRSSNDLRIPGIVADYVPKGSTAVVFGIETHRFYPPGLEPKLLPLRFLRPAVPARYLGSDFKFFGFGSPRRTPLN